MPGQNSATVVRPSKSKLLCFVAENSCELLTFNLIVLDTSTYAIIVKAHSFVVGVILSCCCDMSLCFVLRLSLSCR